MAKSVKKSAPVKKKTSMTCSVAGSKLATKGVKAKAKKAAGSTLGKYC